MTDLVFMSDVEKVALEIRKMLELPLSIEFCEATEFSNPDFMEMRKRVEKLGIKAEITSCLNSYLKDHENIKLSRYISEEHKLFDLVHFAVYAIICKNNNKEAYSSSRQDFNDVVEKITKAVLMPKSIYNELLIIHSCNAGGSIYPEKIAKQFKVSSGLVIGRGMDLGVIA